MSLKKLSSGIFRYRKVTISAASKHNEFAADLKEALPDRRSLMVRWESLESYVYTFLNDVCWYQRRVHCGWSLAMDTKDTSSSRIESLEM